MGTEVHSSKFCRWNSCEGKSNVSIADLSGLQFCFSCAEFLRFWVFASCSDVSVPDVSGVSVCSVPNAQYSREFWCGLFAPECDLFHYDELSGAAFALVSGVHAEVAEFMSTVSFTQQSGLVVFDGSRFEGISSKEFELAVKLWVSSPGFSDEAVDIEKSFSKNLLLSMKI